MSDLYQASTPKPWGGVMPAISASTDQLGLHIDGVAAATDDVAHRDENVPLAALHGSWTTKSPFGRMAGISGDFPQCNVARMVVRMWLTIPIAHGGGPSFR